LGGRRLHLRHLNRSRNDLARVSFVMPFRPMS
jgi:hypothetical protein